MLRASLFMLSAWVSCFLCCHQSKVAFRASKEGCTTPLVTLGAATGAELSCAQRDTAPLWWGAELQPGKFQSTEQPCCCSTALTGLKCAYFVLSLIHLYSETCIRLYRAVFASTVWPSTMKGCYKVQALLFVLVHLGKSLSPVLSWPQQTGSRADLSSLCAQLLRSLESRPSEGPSHTLTNTLPILNTILTHSPECLTEGNKQS